MQRLNGFHFISSEPPDYIHSQTAVSPAPNELSKAWGWLAWKGGGRFWGFGESVAVKCGTKCPCVP